MIRIALLGWGSLVWDCDSEFDQRHGPWEYDGPELKIEFSRISETRKGALTLVLDPNCSVVTQVAHCLSTRSKIADVIEDLKKRERTKEEDYVGCIFRDATTRSRDPASLEAIRTWASDRDLDGVVWTDLPSNFCEKRQELVSPDSVRRYLLTLDSDGLAKALEYAKRAPAFVQTPIRSIIMNVGA